MKKIALLIIGLLIYNCAFLQNMPEIKVKPLKDKGKEKIYYRLKDGFVYFPNTNLIDWQNSLEMLEVTEKYNPKKQYFVESCKFSDGKKNGEFSISTLLLKETRTNYGSILFTSQGADIMTGNYVNSQFNGMINFLTYIDLSSKEGFVNLKYESGKIADQILKYPEVVSAFNSEKNGGFFSLEDIDLFKELTEGKYDKNDVINILKLTTEGVEMLGSFLEQTKDSEDVNTIKLVKHLVDTHPSVMEYAESVLL
jgi:hypothetical protein